MTSFRDPMLRIKDVVSFAPDGSQSTRGPMTAPQIRTRWAAQEFRGRCGDKHEYFSETPDLALVKAVIAHAALRAESEDLVVAVFDFRRAYFYAEEERHLCRTAGPCACRIQDNACWKAAQGAVWNSSICSVVRR